MLRLPPAFPPHFVAFVRRYHQPPSLFVSPVKLQRGKSKTGPDVSASHRGHPKPDSPVEPFGSPRFLGSPLVPLPCSRDPGRAPSSCHSDKAMLPPQVRPRRPQQSCNFRGSFAQLQYSLSTLPDSGFPTLARLASGGWQALTGWDSNPLDSFGEFQVRVHLPPIPTPQTSPGATYFSLLTGYSCLLTSVFRILPLSFILLYSVLELAQK